jgi:creatinine amidohydrolase
MTGMDIDRFFNYDELTWPEVEALPRATPLVLSLGSGYDRQQLDEQLGHPPRIGMLPVFPFGWHGSEIEVPTIVLGRYVGNLLDSLREQGFTRVHLLTSLEKLPLLPEGAVITQPAPASNEPALPFPSERDLGKVILLPIGHTEQHGLHLPLCTDTVIIEAISQGTAAADPQAAFSLPAMPYGVSTHTRSFPGTLSAGGRAFEDFWLAVIHALADGGCDRFYLMSGHGGNMSFLVNVVKYAGEDHPRAFTATAFLHTAGPIGADALERHRTSKLGGMGHACELETSLMLCLRPDLCHMERVVDETDFVATPSYYMDWIEGGALIANPPWDDDTKTGAYGAGSQGTAEKGRIWLAAAVEEKVEQVREIHEQHRRREERRNAGYGRWAHRQTS